LLSIEPGGVHPPMRSWCGQQVDLAALTCVLADPWANWALSKPFRMRWRTLEHRCSRQQPPTQLAHQATA